MIEVLYSSCKTSKCLVTENITKIFAKFRYFAGTTWRSLRTKFAKPRIKFTFRLLSHVFRQSFTDFGSIPRL